MEDDVYMDMTGIDLPDTNEDEPCSLVNVGSKEKESGASYTDDSTAVYGNERTAEQSLRSGQQVFWPVEREASRQSKMYSDDETTAAATEDSCDEYSVESDYSVQSVLPIQRNALSVVNMAFSQQMDDEYCDEEEQTEGDSDASGSEVEPNQYASLGPITDRAMSMRNSNQRDSIIFSSDNDRNVDWEFIDDILNSVGIHARDSRFDPDLFAMRVERTISEAKSPENIGDWLWLLQLRHLEPLFLANGYDNMRFIGPDVLTADSLRFMGIEDESIIGRILQSEAVVRCMQVPKVDHLQQDSSCSTIAQWLQVLHLSQYESNFSAAGCQHIDDVTDAWQLALAINKFAINLLGHRRRLLASLNVKQLKTQLKTFLRQSRMAQQQKSRLDADGICGGIGERGTDTLSAEGNDEKGDVRIFSRHANRISGSVHVLSECNGMDDETNVNNTATEKEESSLVGHESLRMKPKPKNNRNSICKSVTFTELNEALKQLEEGNEITLVADSSSNSVMDQSSSTSSRDNIKNVEQRKADNERETGKSSQLVEDNKNKPEEHPPIKRAFSNLSSLKTRSFKVGFLGVNSFEGIEPTEQSLLSACRNRLAKGVQAVPLVTIQVNFSSLRLLDPKGNISMEHAVTNIQCAAMSSDHKTFAYVVIERKPPSSSWRPLIRRNAPSDTSSALAEGNKPEKTAIKARRMCYIFQALKDGEGQDVMAALKTCFEAAYAFVSSMAQHDQK